MSEPPPQLVAVEIRCIECACVWVQPEERWRVYLSEDEQPQPVAYCQSCAEREFG